MKKILVLGAVDKTGVLLNFMRVLSLTGLNCIYIDGNKNESLSVAVPAIDLNMQVVEFEGFDCAINRAHMNETSVEGYDFALVDTDNEGFIDGVSLDSFDRVYIFTTQERSAINRTKRLINEVLAKREVKTYPMTIILNHFVSTHMDEDYIYDLIDNPYILRSDSVHIFNFDELDYQRHVENSHDERVSLRRVSRHYRKALLNLLEESDIAESSKLVPAMKKARRG
ncbi:hypothetical protein [Paenibacillus sp. Y412MC10]|uniref:hypothetical protein n=1 Tax=Geobacillus sp. (strain Y412MC10) TaxID=481743 RepID=UPI0011AB8075|nr:hypothetical protein [Paenibacillus sp. Y412MC10]